MLVRSARSICLQFDLIPAGVKGRACESHDRGILNGACVGKFSTGRFGARRRVFLAHGLKRRDRASVRARRMAGLRKSGWFNPGDK
jgi:hypothetical protein